MPLMNETTSHASWTAIQILIAAPNREVRTPIVQFQTQIAGSMRQIEADHATLCVTRARNSCHIERLAGRIIHSTQQDQRDLIPRALDQQVDLFIA